MTNQKISPREAMMQLANIPCDKQSRHTVRIVAPLGNQFLIVHSLTKKVNNTDWKEEGWGIPTGQAKTHETAFQAAQREFREETEFPDSMARIMPLPLYVETRNNKTTKFVFTFIALLNPEVQTLLPKKNTEDKGTTEVRLATFDEIIKNQNGKGYSYDGLPFYISSRVAIASAKNAMTEEYDYQLHYKK